MRKYLLILLFDAIKNMYNLGQISLLNEAIQGPLVSGDGIKNNFHDFLIKYLYHW